MTLFLGDFKDADDIVKAFDLKSPLKEDVNKLNILIAMYDASDFDGTVFILYEKDGKLYEVNEFHCSCNGLEFWVPEETFKEALLKRYFYEFNEPIKEALDKL